MSLEFNFIRDFISNHCWCKLKCAIDSRIYSSVWISNSAKPIVGMGIQFEVQQKNIKSFFNSFSHDQLKITSPDSASHFCCTRIPSLKKTTSNLYPGVLIAVYRNAECLLNAVLEDASSFRMLLSTFSIEFPVAIYQ